VADIIDVTQTILSQWLHCRASASNCELVESSLIEWLDYVSVSQCKMKIES
jgi:hypothetical protein